MINNVQWNEYSVLSTNDNFTDLDKEVTRLVYREEKKTRIQDFKIYIQHGQISMIFYQIIWTWNVEWHLEFTNRWNVLYFFSELLWTDELSWNFYKIKYIEFRLKMICHWQSFIYRKFSIIFIINKAELFWYCTWQKAEEF